MIRTIFGSTALLLFLLAGSLSAQAQMSDEAVVRYALSARQAGKSDQQIGRELLARGVTPEQAERLKQKYDSGRESDDDDADRSPAEQRRERRQPAQERLQNEMNLAFNLYNQTAQQLQLARAKVQESTPVYAVVQPASVPVKPSKPSKIILLAGCIFLGGVVSSGWIFVREKRPGRRHDRSNT